MFAVPRLSGRVVISCAVLGAERGLQASGISGPLMKLATDAANIICTCHNNTDRPQRMHQYSAVRIRESRVIRVVMRGGAQII